MLQSTGPRPLILRQQHLSLTPGRVSRTMTGPRTLPVLAAVAPAHNSGNGAAVQQATVVPFTLQDLDAMSAKCVTAAQAPALIRTLSAFSLPPLLP